MTRDTSLNCGYKMRYIIISDYNGSNYAEIFEAQFSLGLISYLFTNHSKKNYPL